MAAEIHNFYQAWLAEHPSGESLADRGGEGPPEKLLQGVWAYQRLLRDKLFTVDGQPVRVLHPGFWNRGAGPDFQKAMIQIGQETPKIGDIEIDLETSGWDQHAHAHNPAYAGVILHVLWEEGTKLRKTPALCLKPYLDASLEELQQWLSSESKGAPEGMSGNCSAPFKALDHGVVRAVLKQAAQARLQRKAALFQARARQAGWEQALWEGAFTALGYKRNVWPMRRLAELRPLYEPENSADPLTLQARLLGLAGLLPEEPVSSAKSYVRQLWDIWWRERDQFSSSILPRKIWNFSGLRPANHPERRLALAAHWLTDAKFFEKLEMWITVKMETAELLSSLQQVLATGADPYWNFHWTLRSVPLKNAQPLLGPQRLTDLAMNVFLPWLWVRALAGRNGALQRAVELRYFHWPCGEDNSVLQLGRQRLFGTKGAEYLHSAAEQQGLMQIVRDFCDYSNAACDHCKFPELLQTLENKRKLDDS